MRHYFVRSRSVSFSLSFYRLHLHLLLPDSQAGGEEGQVPLCWDEHGPTDDTTPQAKEEGQQDGLKSRRAPRCLLASSRSLFLHNTLAYISSFLGLAPRLCIIFSSSYHLSSSFAHLLVVCLCLVVGGFGQACLGWRCSGVSMGMGWLCSL